MTRPRLKTDGALLPGLAAVALFVVLAAAFVPASFGTPAGFGENAAVMKSLGAALFNIDPTAVVDDGSAVPSEGFLAAFIIIAVALDAALDGSVFLARREETGDAAMTDGGRTDGSDRRTGTGASADGGDD